MDENRVAKMITAALTNDPALMPALMQMAEEYEGPLNAFARVLLGKESFPWEEELEEPTRFSGDPSVDEWKQFIRMCRTAAEDVATSSSWGDFLEDEEDQEYVELRIPSAEEWKRRAWIGQWHDRVPPFRGESIPDWYGPNAWAYAWANQAAPLEGFLKGSVPSWSPLGDYRQWVVAAGLVRAFEYDLIEPLANWLPFAVAFGRWTQGLDPHGIEHQVGLGNLLAAIGHGDPSLLTPDELQALACFSWNASWALGQRHIPLAIPALQNVQDWINGYLNSLREESTLEEAAQRFVNSADPIERYLLATAHQHTRETDSEDPFGPGRSAFWRAAGQHESEVPCPTYGQCLAHLSQ